MEDLTETHAQVDGIPAPLTVTDARDIDSTGNAGLDISGDGYLIDQDLLPATPGPPPDGWQDHDPPKKVLPNPTRVLTRSIDMTNYNPGDPVQLWPADPLRTWLHIEAIVPPIHIFTTSATTPNKVIQSISTSSTNTGLTWTRAVSTVDTAGFLILIGSVDGVTWTQLQSTPLNASSTLETFFTSPAPPFIQVLISGTATGAGSVSSLIDVANGAEYFAFASERINSLSAVPTIKGVDNEYHTGPVYVAKSYPNGTVINSWVITQ